MKQDSAVIVLKALLTGYRLTINHHTYVMADDSLCVVAHKDDGSETLWSVEMSFNTFIKMCKELSEDEIAVIAMNMTLTSSKSVRR